MTQRLILLCILFIVALPHPALAAAPEEDIQKLLEKGSAAAAYDLGRKNADKLGEPTFDFYFGIAAIDSGHAGEGVLALERYVVTYPGNLNARLELARGYFVMNDDQRAREEFSGVLDENPPASVRANIEKFMDAMRTRESVYRTKVGASLETGFGYDTNANGGVESPNVSLPIFGNVTISQTGVRAPTAFKWTALNGQISHPIAPALTFFGSGHVDGKFHNSAQQFDQHNISGSGGLAWLKNKNTYRAAATHTRLAVDDERFRNITDVTGEWTHQINELKAFSAFGQYALLRYAGANTPRNANLTAAGLGFRKSFIGSWQPQFTASVNGGREHDNQNRPDLGRDVYGGRVAIAGAPARRWLVSAGGSFQGSSYDGADTLLETWRQDNYYAADVVANYAWTRKLSLRGELLLAQNDSNIALYAYRRGTVTFKVHYEFK